MRGKRQTVFLEFFVDRNIPAYAGKTEGEVCLVA